MNPYHAPKSVIQDPPSAPRPKEVALACRILWIVFFVSLVTLHPEIRGEWWVLSTGEQTGDQVIPGKESALEDLEQVWPVFIVGITVVFSAIYVFLVWTTGKGHNWARWLLLAFILGTEALGLSDYGRSLQETPLAFAADLCVLAAEIWALWLLFSGAGAAWYKATG